MCRVLPADVLATQWAEELPSRADRPSPPSHGVLFLRSNLLKHMGLTTAYDDDQPRPARLCYERLIARGGAVMTTAHPLHDHATEGFDKACDGKHLTQSVQMDLHHPLILLVSTGL